MAERIYTVTVASGNLYGGGTGSVYYLDGARNSTGPGTVSWVEGGTLRFEQSAASNDNHPLIFSTNTSTSGIISSGVTYYLDGSSNQSDYVNTSTFNAATTRYVEITPSSQTDFYYLCYIHGIGMGGIFDITQSTWGALTWSQGNWSAQNNQTISVTGIAATSSLGSQTIELNTFETVTGIASLLSVGSSTVDLLNNGWGANTWSFSEWGQVGNLVTGQSLTTAIGSGIASIDASVSVSGQSLTSSIGNEVVSINQTIAATGQTLNTSVGILDPVPIIVGSSLTSSVGAVQASGVIEVGWGGDSWGQNQWGELNAPTETVTTAGLLQTASGAIASITANADITVSGIAATLSQGEDISGTSHTQAVTTAGLLQMFSESSVIDIGVPVTGVSTSMSAGQTTIDPTFLIGQGWGRDTWGNQAWNVNYSVAVTGQALASSIGNEEAGTDSQPTITGQQASLSFGTFSIKVDQDISLTVSEHTMNSALGSPSLVQSTNESATGQSLATAINSVEAFQNTPVDVSGISMSISLGNESLVQSTTEVVSGQSLATSIGTPTEIPAQNVGVTGLSLTSAMGEESTVSNANIPVTGIVLTSSAGSTNITAWQEVDLGVNNTWTEVDLAA